MLIWVWGLTCVCRGGIGSQRLARTYAFKLLCLTQPKGATLNIVITMNTYEAARN